MATKLGHVILYVADMDKAVAFYRDIAGLALKFASPEWSEFATGDTTLALHRASPQWPASHAQPGMIVPDIAAFYQELRAKGVTFTRPPKQEEHGWLADFVDTDGIEWSVSQG